MELWGYWSFIPSLRTMGERAEKPLQRGEIVVFLTPHDPSKIAVKRIVGLPGDIVKPLEGYEGDDEVIIQYNHMWVEGDADDREKSRDSNWYGPISQSLVIGRVIAIMEPWWSPRWLDLEQHKWPARQKGRVQEKAIKPADPDEDAWKKDWLDGRAQFFLDKLQTESTWVTNLLMTSADKRKEMARLYAHAVKERSTDDPRTREATGSLIDKLDDIFTKAGLQLVLDEHNFPILKRTEEGEHLIREHWRKKSDEEKYTPNQLLERKKKQMDMALARSRQELQQYDDWAWYEKYRPRSVLEAKLHRVEREFEEQMRILEEDLERERRLEEKERRRREAERVVAPGHQGVEGLGR